MRNSCVFTKLRLPAKQGAQADSILTLIFFGDSLLMFGSQQKDNSLETYKEVKSDSSLNVKHKLLVFYMKKNNSNNLRGL